MKRTATLSSCLWLLFVSSALSAEPTAEALKFWSFQPLKDVVVPKVTTGAWFRNNIDRFALAKLEAKGITGFLQNRSRTQDVVPFEAQPTTRCCVVKWFCKSPGITPNAEAARRVLIWRLYFDVCGLPPEPAVVEAFVNDDDLQAYEKLVDRLLESVHYGERWGRLWLDLERFAESNGYAFDIDRRAAYHYRDFVIKALNQDMPYDEFTRLQFEGDLLKGNDYIGQSATGLLASGTFTSQLTQNERERIRYEQLDDLIATVGTATLGLTLGCARCHDHKFDPVPSHDDYRLIASFAETGFQNFQFDRQPEKYKCDKAEFDKQHKPFIDARLAYEKESLPRKLAEWLVNRHNEG